MRRGNTSRARCTPSESSSPNWSVIDKRRVTNALWFSGSTWRMSRQILSAAEESFNNRYRSAFCSAAGTPAFVIGFSSIAHLTAVNHGSQPAPLLLLSARIDLYEFADRIEEFINHALFERDDSVVGDRD